MPLLTLTPSFVEQRFVLRRLPQKILTQWPKNDGCETFIIVAFDVQGNRDAGFRGSLPVVWSLVEIAEAFLLMNIESMISPSCRESLEHDGFVALAMNSMLHVARLVEGQ